MKTITPYLKYSKLNNKLLFVIVLNIFVLFSVIGAVRSYQAKQSLAAEIAVTGHNQSTLIAAAVSEQVLSYDYSNLEILVDELVNREDVISVEVSNNSRVMVSRQNKTYVSTNSAHEATFFAPVIYLGKQIGSVKIQLSVNKFHNNIRQIHITIIAATIFSSVVLSMILFFAITKLVVTPVKQVIDAAYAMSIGNFDSKLPKIKNDEIGKLLYAFSTMRESIAASKTELETKIELRTRELEQEKIYFSSIINDLSEGVIVLDGNYEIITANKAAEKIFCYDNNELTTKPISSLTSFERIGYQNKKSVYIDIDAILDHNEEEVVGIRKGSERFPLGIKLSRLLLNNNNLIIITARDLSEKKEAEEKINFLATHDALTGLPNRTLLTEHVNHAIAQSNRRGTQSALMFVDLDKFKQVNDTLGHDVGDLLLKEVASRLLLSVREEDVVARYGGDEFIVLLSTITNHRDEEQVANKIIKAIRAPYYIFDHVVNISASIGISLCDGKNKSSMEDLLQQADRAMYKAKENGKNQFKLYVDA